MKAAFNIPPPATGNDQVSLLIEAADHGISFLWFMKVPFSVKGLISYNFADANLTSDMRFILSSLENYLAGLSSATICYDFKESLLVPEKYNQGAMSEQALSLVYGENDQTVLNNDLVTSAIIYNHYRVPKAIATVFSERFPKAAIFHSTSLQLEQLNQEKNLLYCIIYLNTIKAILYKEEKLQIVQQFKYNSPEDVAYHLLNICEQFGAKPSDIELRLSGMVDEQSKLYIELYNYFLNVKFENVAEGIYTADELKELPAHFFSHLISLALCVS